MSITLVKLGGSLITDKKVESSFRREVMNRIAQEIAFVLEKQPDLQLVIGHGSGSFGHFAATRYKTIRGVQTREEWRGFAEVATVAAELNYLVSKSLYEAGVPVWRVQPSASAICADGVIQGMALEPLITAVQSGIVPLVYGDVAIDTVRGGTIISTETIFTYLVEHLPVKQVLLVGEVGGVYDSSGDVIERIDPSNFEAMREFIGGSAGTDVTGGMLTKVSDMFALAQKLEGLEIRIIDGTQPDLLRQSLLGEAQFGTLIRGR
jgi:isopentenyl phosphate kinase